MTNPVAYKITVYALGFSDSIPISEEEFRRIRQAKRMLVFGIGLEEKLDLVLENYAEFERDLLNMALEHSIFPGKIDALLDGGTHLVNRRIANFLTTTRLYLDQVLSDLSRIYGQDSVPYKTVKESTHREYDSVLGYRVMAALRNHVQHRSLPTHAITFAITRDEASNPQGIRYRVVPSVNVATLEDNPKFKKAVLSELKAVADKNLLADLVPFVRECAESFGRIHQGVREATASQFCEADKLIAEYRARASEKFGDRLEGLVAAACDDQGLCKDLEHLVDRPTNRRRDLEKKNQHLNSISRRYVSSSP